MVSTQTLIWKAIIKHVIYFSRKMQYPQFLSVSKNEPSKVKGNTEAKATGSYAVPILTKSLIPYLIIISYSK